MKEEILLGGDAFSRMCGVVIRAPLRGAGTWGVCFPGVCSGTRGTPGYIPSALRAGEGKSQNSNLQIANGRRQDTAWRGGATIESSPTSGEGAAGHSPELAKRDGGGVRERVCGK